MDKAPYLAKSNKLLLLTNKEYHRFYEKSIVISQKKNYNLYFFYFKVFKEK